MVENILNNTKDIETAEYLAEVKIISQQFEYILMNLTIDQDIFLIRMLKI